MIVHAGVSFNKTLQDWEGFGFNYVETAQTIDYSLDPQDYGGFSLMTEEKKLEIIDLIFGENGLKPGVIKMFLDPFHQKENNLNLPGPENIDERLYDHKTSVRNIVDFVKRGCEETKKRGETLKIVTTLYGPPPFMTKQKIMRGRDLDPAFMEEYAKYAVSWAKWLRKEGLPICFISLHNEGEDYHRWPEDGKNGNIGTGHDYNLYWPPKMLAEFLVLVRKTLDAAGLHDVGVTPGETTNWTRFYNWGYADAICDIPGAVESLGLITSHGFSAGAPGLRWHGDHRSSGQDALMKIRPDLHTWVTSTSWATMDAKFVYQIHGNIYGAKSNAIIPWAGIQRPVCWVGGDPNPGNAIQVAEDGSYIIRDGYYYYKQVTSAGRSGMKVSKAYATAGECCAIAFAKGNTQYPNAFVLVNCSENEALFDVEISGSNAKLFSVYITDKKRKYAALPDVEKKNGKVEILLSPNSVCTLIEK